MARSRPPERLDQLLAAAAKVFRSRGYRRTQMADIARAMGVAPGTLYLYVESKEALFHLLVERGWTDGAPRSSRQLPLRTPSPGATLTLLRRRLMQGARLPTLEAALARRRVDDPRAEFEGIVRELYARVAANREAVMLLERSALDWPELAALFYREMRSGLLRQLAQYLERRIRQGRLRRVPDAAAAARLINETVAWFAMHRYGDQHAADLDDRVAEETVVDALVNAYAKE